MTDILKINIFFLNILKMVMLTIILTIIIVIVTFFFIFLTLPYVIFILNNNIKLQLRASTSIVLP
jgi:hypothetical protein